MKIKRNGEVVEVTNDYILQEGEEAVTEETGEETPEEKALFEKIKTAVSATVKAEIEASKSKILVKENETDGPAIKDMSEIHMKMWNKQETPEAKKDFESLVICQRYIKALYEHDYSTVKDLSEGTDSEGGYLVPAPLAARIFEIVIAEGHARREMTTVPMNSQTLDLTTLVTKPTVAYIAEGAQITASDLVFGRKTLTAVKLAGITAMSNEVIQDANINLLDFNIKKFAEAFMEQEDGDFFNTSSSGSVTGVLEDANTTLTTMGATDVDFADLAYADLVDVVQAIGSRQRKGAKWCFSSYVMGLVMKLVDSQGLPIWNRPVKDGNPPTLLGFPVIENDKMPDLSDTAVSTKFIAFGNFKDYLIGDRQQVTATILKEATVGGTNLAEKDSTGLRVIERISGLAPTPAQFSVLRTAAA